MNKPDLKSALCFLPFLGWMPAAAFLLFEKGKELKLQAATSLILTFLLIGVYWVVIPLVWATVVFRYFTFTIQGLVGVVYFGGSLLLMIKAYNHEDVTIPLLSEWADILVKRLPESKN